MNRDQVIAYLLHQMPEPERLQYAEQWMGDPELYEQLRMIEDELLDAYVRNEVSASERTLIERYLLTSESQRRKLAFAQAMHRALPRKAKRQVAWQALAAAAALIITSAAAIWFGVENAALRQQQAEQRFSVQPAGAVTALFLPSAAVRSGVAERAVTLAGDTEVVRLDLEIEAGEPAAIYNVTVSRSGSVVWRAEPVRASSRTGSTVASVWVPSAVLDAGRYEVALRTDTTALAYYEFRIVR